MNLRTYIQVEDALKTALDRLFPDDDPKPVYLGVPNQAEITGKDAYIILTYSSTEFAESLSTSITKDAVLYDMFVHHRVRRRPAGTVNRTDPTGVIELADRALSALRGVSNIIVDGTEPEGESASGSYHIMAFTVAIT